MSVSAAIVLSPIVTMNERTIAFICSPFHRLLQEILATRVMVKNSMKLHKSNRKLERMLDARQLGLKLIANVTYGYTAAHFSGRMPCVEVHTVLGHYLSGFCP